MKAVLQFRSSENLRRLIEATRPSWLEVRIIDEADEAAFEREMRDASVLLHVLKPVTAGVIERAPSLRLIQKIGVGVNTIDVASAAVRNIAVTNMPGTNTQAVVEATLLLMLAALRRATYFDSMVASGLGWSIPPKEFDTLGELQGRTVGLVGYGAIPRRLAPVLAALGASVIYYARSPSATDIGTAVPMPQLIERSDVISLHLPLTPETHGFVGHDEIQRMKPGVVLINTARGALLDEAALIAALRSGHVRAAGLDVFEHEPLEAGSGLRSLGNVVRMPHVAWLTPETLARSMRVAMENCSRLREGRALLHRVA